MSSRYGRSNPLLTRLSVDRRNAADGYIAEFVAPSLVDTSKSFGEYYVFDEKNNMKNPDNRKADGGVSREIVLAASTDNYKTEQYGSRAWYTQKEINDFGNESMLREAKMNMVTDADMVSHELRVAGIVTNAGSYASANKVTLDNTSNKYQWDDYVNSDPFLNVTNGIKAVHGGDGVDANAMVVSYDIHHALKRHPDILSRMQAQGIASGLEDVTARKIGELFGLEYRVAKAQYVSSDEGQSTVTKSYAWGDFALIFHRNPTPAKMSISLAYNFTYQDFQFRTYYKEESKRFYVDNDHDCVTKLVAPSVGYLISDVLS